MIDRICLFVAYSKLTRSELLIHRSNLIDELDAIHQYLFEHYHWRPSDADK